MAPINPSDIAAVEIWPPIGIARMGNSEQGYWIAPEIPYSAPIPDNGFRDDSGKIKREACRFHVYAYGSDGQVLGELDETSGYDLHWSADIANSKAAFWRFYGKHRPRPTVKRNPKVQGDLEPDQRDRLILKAHGEIQGLDKTSSALEGTFRGSNNQPAQIYLGELKTDDRGRLVFLGGRGHSHCVLDGANLYPMIMSEFDAEDWVDDACDGKISVRVTHKNLEVEIPQPKYSGWVVCAPPKFGHGARSQTSLYDLFEEVYEQRRREKEGQSYQVDPPVFYQHIWEVFESVYEMSWLNVHAQHGHGANGHGYPLHSKETILASPAKESELDRQRVLKAIRVPTSAKYDELRATQSTFRYMPRMSGDDGDMPEDGTFSDNKNRFASLTELQYDRMHKWALGQFTTGEKKIYEKFEDIPLQQQPAALAKAALQWTIGTPLYPGIEMWWKAESPDWYDFSTLEPTAGSPRLFPPFRIASTTTPGDLTQNLSMPWQSDFYLCNTHWWPSARPDDVVTLTYFDKIKELHQGAKPDELAKFLVEREPWDRGIQTNWDNQNLQEGLPFRGNHSLAMNWHNLGFIAPVQIDTSVGGEPVILVEGQRNRMQPEPRYPPV